MNRIKITSHKKLAMAMAGLLFLLWLTQPFISEWTGSAPLTTGEKAKSTEVSQPGVLPADRSAVDPFKENIQQNGLSTQAVSAPVPASPAATGADPFKAFLASQKEQSQAANISPFGK